MGAISIKTTKEIDVFLIRKKADLMEKGVKVNGNDIVGNNHVVLYIIEQAMKDKKG